MSILDWNESFLVGVPEFDDHHKHLIGLLNRTYDEYSRDPAGGKVEGILQELAQYALYHFGAEERWMNEISYPDLAGHRKEHACFNEKIAAFQEQARAGQATSSALFFFLADWLSAHILERDHEYAHFKSS